MENTVENIEQTTAPKGSESYWLKLLAAWGFFSLMLYMFNSGVEVVAIIVLVMIPVLFKVTLGSKARVLKGKELQEEMDRMAEEEMTSPIYSSLPGNINYQSNR